MFELDIPFRPEDTRPCQPSSPLQSALVVPLHHSQQAARFGSRQSVGEPWLTGQRPALRVLGILLSNHRDVLFLGRGEQAFRTRTRNQHQVLVYSTLEDEVSAVVLVSFD